MSDRTLKKYIEKAKGHEATSEPPVTRVGNGSFNALKDMYSAIIRRVINSTAYIGGQYEFALEYQESEFVGEHPDPYYKGGMWRVELRRSLYFVLPHGESLPHHREHAAVATCCGGFTDTHDLEVELGILIDYLEGFRLTNEKARETASLMAAASA